MNDQKYLKKMTSLTVELELAATAEPYDPDVYNDVVDRLNKIVPPWERRRRRWPWMSIFAIISLLLILLWIILEILYLS